jgi:hypothetical protein
MILCERPRDFVLHGNDDLWPRSCEQASQLSCRPEPSIIADRAGTRCQYEAKEVHDLLAKAHAPRLRRDMQCAYLRCR